jgi:hypothetical protein
LARRLTSAWHFLPLKARNRDNSIDLSTPSLRTDALILWSDRGSRAADRSSLI